MSEPHENSPATSDNPASSASTEILPAGDAASPARTSPPATVSQVVAISGTRIVAGPLPDPQTLHEYETFIPGSAERIMKFAETNAGRHHESRKLGQYGGIVIAVFSLAVAGIAFVFSDAWYVATAAVLVAAFGVGGPAAGRTFVDRFSRRNGHHKGGGI